MLVEFEAISKTWIRTQHMDQIVCMLNFIEIQRHALGKSVQLLVDEELSCYNLYTQSLGQVWQKSE